VAASQSLTAPSSEPGATILPSGEKATALTQLVGGGLSDPVLSNFPWIFFPKS